MRSKDFWAKSYGWCDCHDDSWSPLWCEDYYFYGINHRTTHHKTPRIAYFDEDHRFDHKMGLCSVLENRDDLNKSAEYLLRMWLDHWQENPGQQYFVLGNTWVNHKVPMCPVCGYERITIRDEDGKNGYHHYVNTEFIRGVEIWDKVFCSDDCQTLVKKAVRRQLKRIRKNWILSDTQRRNDESWLKIARQKLRQTQKLVRSPEVLASARRELEQANNSPT